ncbi:MAG: hypothetical protein IKG61_00370 [Selenomonadaceae bacterium]|nr:hypothetical protein [Selenomonadaceae bacterium]
MAKKHFYEYIKPAMKEDALVHYFANYFKIRNFDSANYIDLYTPEIFFEFKTNENFKNPSIFAETVAQALYYAKRLYSGDDPRPLSPYISVVTKKFGAYFETNNFFPFYSNETRYDWDLPPSSPCKILVADLTNSKIITDAIIYEFADVSDEIKFTTDIQRIRKKTSRFEKKLITPNNFDAIFNYWQSLFGKAVKNSHKPSEYFITDIEGDKSEISGEQVVFHMTDGKQIYKPIDIAAYKAFWSQYEKIRNHDTIITVRQRMDRMTEENLRRFTGEFYTPKLFADKAVEYLQKTVGDWWQDDNFRLWDMAAGTGNLEFSLPAESLAKCYISTLIKDEADYCAKIFPAATCFQYDYLNDDAAKLPENLRADLANPNIRWIIFINPPYVTANNYERDKTKINKDTVSMTAIQKTMTEENLGEVSRELFSQFIYRISKDFSNRNAYLCMFSKLKYINSTNDQKFRDKIFRFKFERGFMFDSKNFDGCKANFPVGFLIWNLSKFISLEEQEIKLEIWEKYKSDFLVRPAAKIFHAANRADFLNKWIDRPPCTKKFPPLSSGLTVAYKNKDRRDRIAENFLASFMCNGNDFMHQNRATFLSAPYVSAGALSITPENFEQAMIVHMVRRLPKATWLNDRDQFLQPNKILPREFVTDAVIWSLFAPSNQTASLRDVEYEGEIYQIRNNFFPFALSELKSWECTLPAIKARLEAATEDRFAATWIKNNRADLSSEALAILSAGRDIYKRFYAELDKVDVWRWKIDDWDAGWYQVRMALNAKLTLDELTNKLEPQIYELGFLRDEVRYF